MNFTNLAGSAAGWLHLTTAFAAMASGLLVLLTEKGTAQHRRIGYVYVASMAVMLITSFMIYRLFGRFGIFHWLAILSTLTLLAGLLPILKKGPKKDVAKHFGFMYWSVIGLYGAFVAEVFVRLPRMILTADGKPNLIFYKMVGWAVALVVALGTFYFIKFKNRWTDRFVKNKNSDSV